MTGDGGRTTDAINARIGHRRMRFPRIFASVCVGGDSYPIVQGSANAD
jgi:hypothetical protein